jgi:hypothetical protein
MFLKKIRSVPGPDDPQPGRDGRVALRAGEKMTTCDSALFSFPVFLPGNDERNSADHETCNNDRIYRQDEPVAIIQNCMTGNQCQNQSR